MKYNYYPCYLDEVEDPVSVFRFPTDHEQNSQRYQPNTGWVDDRDLILLFATGELAEDDEITEQQADKIIGVLDSNNKP